MVVWLLFGFWIVFIHFQVHLTLRLIDPWWEAIWRTTFITYELFLVAVGWHAATTHLSSSLPSGSRRWLAWNPYKWSLIAGKKTSINRENLLLPYLGNNGKKPSINQLFHEFSGYHLGTRVLTHNHILIIHFFLTEGVDVSSTIANECFNTDPLSHCVGQWYSLLGLIAVILGWPPVVYYTGIKLTPINSFIDT